jgi:hypothetical protein
MLRTSRTSIEDDGEARMNFSGEKTDRRQGILGGGSTEIAKVLGGAMKMRARGVNGVGLTGRVYIDPWPRDSCSPSAPSISNSQTLDQFHVSTGKM